MDAVIPLRFGVRFRPPSLALEYKSKKGVELLEMAVVVTPESTAEDLFVVLQKQHKALNPTTVSVKQVKRLLELLIENNNKLEEKPTPVLERPLLETTASEEETTAAEERHDEALGDEEEEYEDDIEEIDDEIVDESGELEFVVDDDDVLSGDDDDDGYTFD